MIIWKQRTAGLNMAKLVYIVRDHGAVIREELEKRGFQVVVGNGTPDPEILARCSVLMPGGKVTVDAGLLSLAPNLELVAKSGVGVDRIDIDACTGLGITVANTPLTNIQSVAEHTMMLMLACAKKLYPISLYLRHTYPDFWCRERYEGVELFGKNLTVAGMGNIGRKVAGLAQAFGMRVTGYDPFADPAKFPEGVRPEADLHTALRNADFVTLHVAGTPQTRGMIGAEELACMKPSAVLINVSRGSVVDENALIAALQNGVIAGAGLDVFADEPLRPGNPLMLMENVTATPHCAGNTADARLRTQWDCLENITEYFDGRTPRFALNHPKRRVIQN